MPNASGIYCIQNKVNGKRYIGSAKNIKRRWLGHKSALNLGKHQNRYLQRAWNKYGEGAFEFIILMECLPVACLFFEQCFLDAEQPEYNICQKAVSPLGVKRTEETRRKLKELHKNDKPSIKTQMAALSANIGRPCSAEKRKKISEAQKGRKFSDEHRANISRAGKGRKMSNEERLRRKGQGKGRVCSPETRRKISEANKKRHAEGRYKKWQDIGAI